jgi:alpha-tubulin suppressor-like RCC1 family protein
MASPVVQIAAGLGHTCARRKDGSVSCWGWNDFRQLGNQMGQACAGYGCVPNPTPVPMLPPAVDVSLGDRHSCAALGDGTVMCWGRNYDFQLGAVAAESCNNQPCSSKPLVAESVSGVDKLALGKEGFSCAHKTDNTLLCWGYNYYGQLGATFTCQGGGPKPAAVFGQSSAQMMSAGGNHACALQADTSVQCWGHNSFYQLGTTSSCSSGANQLWNQKPLSVTGLSGVVEVAAGGSATCARKQDGTVVCWGDNSVGYLGAPSMDPCPGNANLSCSKTPVTAQGLTSVIQLSSGIGHACALKMDGTVMCWGANNYGQLGAKSKDTCLAQAIPCSLTPLTVTGLTSVVEIDAGGSHTCARKMDGSVWCWGWNAMGQLGDGTTTDHLMPAPVKL